MGKRTALARRITQERQAIQMQLRKMVRQTMNGLSVGQDLSDDLSRDVLEHVERGLLKEQEARTCELLTSRIKALDQAWANLQRGTYGICRLCGKQIPWKRLEAVPGTTFCVSCQEVVE